ncbi:hypothetical protein B9G79_00320 [Bdellovibrio bacteriovorus]|uniref:Uncharacterized protein n=1 Tax=Bdellovibrio bacteriovorus TaxID=959 RepID=A0A1Z3N3S7_BDEBC|nr:hypothetical protein B9G79_00320 [Bdellovibrio bacteriovorus]
MIGEAQGTNAPEFILHSNKTTDPPPVSTEEKTKLAVESLVSAAGLLIIESTGLLRSIVHEYKLALLLLPLLSTDLTEKEWLPALNPGNTAGLAQFTKEAPSKEHSYPVIVPPLGLFAENSKVAVVLFVILEGYAFIDAKGVVRSMVQL